MSVLVVGAGGHAKVVVATLQAAGQVVAGCLDDDPAATGRIVLGVPVLGPVALLAAHDGLAILAVGDNAARRSLAEAFPGIRWATAIHPAAIVHPTVTVGEGAVVFAGAIVQPDTEIGRHAIVNTAASVDHDGRIGEYAHVAPGVHLSGGVDVGEGVLLGVGCCVAPGCAVGPWAVVGAGAAVVGDLPAYTTCVGVPARPLP